ncbi:GIY-YIG nuclease family protein [Agrobacterium pusense]|uniref:GIY-YIG nuclease family protein n=1 Tax=Agrobacterium pusense TaxID=648995 RepID=UPI0010BE26AB|nr:GIY-YIG nuclease family protein [Agrobacterium pusense]QCL83358.1 GIY-YIG nuclease family protein [Agrobacterium pusense]
MTVEFEGSRSDAEAFLRDHAGRFYVYVLYRPDGQPFYVGKGINKRVFDHEAEARRHHPFGESNPFKCNVIRKIIRDRGEVGYRIDRFYDSENQMECLEREAELIQTYKRLHEGGCLTNLAGGLGNMSGAAPFSLERHAATLSGEPENNPQRATLNRFLLSIGPVASIPIKPLDQISRVLPSTPHPSSRSPTARCAYALIASASAEGLRLTEGVQISRTFVYEGVRAVIENGVSRDLLKANMAALVPANDPTDEKYLLSGEQVRLIERLVGRQHLTERGLL